MKLVKAGTEWRLVCEWCDSECGVLSQFPELAELVEALASGKMAPAEVELVLDDRDCEWCHFLERSTRDNPR